MMPGTAFVRGDPRAGRPRGARNKLATTVLRDLLDVWNEPAGKDSDVTKGVAALRIMAGSLLPRELTIEAVADLADDQVDAMIERLSQELLLEHKVAPKELELRLPDDYHVQDN